MRLPGMRSFIGRTRFRYFVHLRKKLRTIDSDGAHPVTVEHNLKGLQDHTNARMERLIRPLVSIETVDADSDVLVVGPRTEADLLLLIGYGLKSGKVRGLDLISYSPWIDLGDMHAMPYEDDSFDVSILGWVLAYSAEPEKVADELVRVTRDGGLVAIGLEYSEMTGDDLKELIGYEIEESERPRINSVPQILELFGDRVRDVYYRHDAPKRVSHTREGYAPNPSSVIVIFSVDKGGADSAGAKAEGSARAVGAV